MKPTPLYIATKAVIVQDQKILLLWRNDGQFWDLPGGRMGLGEQLVETLKRELKEELPDFHKYEIQGVLGLRKKEDPLKDGVELFLMYFKVIETSPENKLTLSSEHSHHRFFSEENLLELGEPFRSVYSELLKRSLLFHLHNSEVSENSLLI